MNFRGDPATMHDARPFVLRQVGQKRLDLLDDVTCGVVPPWRGSSGVLVSLIRPPRLFSRTALTTNVPVPPLGLAYLAGALRAGGFETLAIDACGEALDQCRPLDDLPFVMNGLDADEIAARVPAESLFVGVSCMFSCEWLVQKRVIEAVRRRLPGVPIVVGGEHATADPIGVLRSCPAVTACALGEGDDTVVAIAEALVGERPLAGVAGLVLRDGDGAIVQTARRERIRAVDALSWPAWDALPLATYLDRGFGMDEYNVRSMPMLASRGCPYRCTFCSSPQMWGTTWLARDPGDVVREIRHYVERYRIEHVEFHDLTTIIDRRWILRFTEALQAADLGVTWTMPSGTRSEALDAEVLDRLKRSGCRGISYAPESGSPATLARIKKRVRPERMLQSIRAATAAGMYVKVHFIIGLPGQSLGEIWESSRFILRLLRTGVHDVLVYPFNAYPGSELYGQLVAAGRIDPTAPDYERQLLGADYADLGRLRSWSEDLSASSVRRIAALTMLCFYGGQYVLRPWRGVAMLVRTLAARPNTWFQRALTTGFRRVVRRRFVPAPSTSVSRRHATLPAPRSVGAGRAC
jgi:anaerobic magnesium-protoporphyrin IX monomethyl ester cyclase